MPYRPFQSTYYDAQMRASPALLRARASYLVKNTLLGTAICATVISIYAYTINVISQDEFDDVIVPDEPLQRPQQPVQGGKVSQAIASARK